MSAAVPFFFVHPPAAPESSDPGPASRILHSRAYTISFCVTTFDMSRRFRSRTS